MILNTLYEWTNSKISASDSKEIHKVEYAPWSQEEINDYKQIDYMPLLNIYKEKNLNNPESRTEFIAEKLLDLTLTDHELLMRISKSSGRGVALSSLEQWAEKFLRECFP